MKKKNKNKGLTGVILSVLLSCTCISASAQSGISWGASMNIAAGTYSGMHPRMTLDRAGNPLVVWGRMSDGAVWFSRWTDSTFSVPVKLNPSWLKAATASWQGPDIASKGDTVYVVMKRAPETADTNHIYIVTSFNGGMSFSAPVRVDFIGSDQSRFPTVTTDAAGNPIVAFMKFNSSMLESRWVVTKSADFGNTFTPDVKASGYSGATAEVCDCCPGAIVSAGNVSAMLYRDNLSNIRDIWAGISTNSSANFGSGFAVDNNNWMFMSCPSSGPDGVIIGDSLYSVFMSAGGGSTRSYLSRSSISGGAANSVSKLTGTISGLGMQNFPRIATDGKAAAIVWVQTVGGSVQLPLLFTNNIAAGLPTVYDTVDLNNITNTDVAMGNNKIFVVWEDGSSGTVKFRRGTYVSSSTTVSEVSSKGCSIFPNPTQGNFTIQLDNLKSQAKISLINAVGTNVLELHTFDSETTIDLSGFAAGVYFVRVEADHAFSFQKMVKQ